MNLSRTIDQGLEFLAATQQKDGGYESLSSATPDFVTTQTYHTTFIPSLILSTLVRFDSSLAVGIKNKLAGFLQDQRDENWSFNYWTKNSPERMSKPYPNDLDDTFCAASALYAHDSRLIDGTALAKLTHLLTHNEVREGGPYRTWLVDPDADKVWQDIDVVVNINIGYFLSLHGVELPSIVHDLEQAMPELSSPYYVSNSVPSYFAGRWYKGERAPELLTNLSGSDLLSEAMYISTAITINQVDITAIKTRIERIVHSQSTDGSWPALAFCVDPAINGSKHYAGARALTTALCLEALALYSSYTQRIPKNKKSKNNTVLRAQRTINSLPLPEIRTHTKKALRDLMASGNEEQILSLPWLIQHACHTNADHVTLEQLASISLWGWMAYTIYDDFLDQEGDPLKLSSAHVCLRNLMITISKTMPDNKSFQGEVITILDRQDAANTWEITHCRVKIRDNILTLRNLPDYGDYWQLAERSLGHTISGLGVLYAAGEASTSKDMNALRSFFRHFLIARQLNDDAHDWLDDLYNGHINAAAVKILQSYSKKVKKPMQEINLDKETEDLQKIMWDTAIEQVCKDIFKHVQLARKAIAQTDFNKPLLEKLLNPVESAAMEALHKRDQTQDFIAAL